MATAQLLSCSLELNLELNLQLALAAGCHRPYRSGESRRDQLHSGLTSRKSTYDEISEPRIASRVNVWGGVYTVTEAQKVTTIAKSELQSHLINTSDTWRPFGFQSFGTLADSGLFRPRRLPTRRLLPSHETGNLNFEFDLLIPKVRSTISSASRLYETRAVLRRDCYHPTVRLSRGAPRLL